MKKIIFSLLFLVIFFFISSKPAFAQEKILSFDTSIKINQDGTLDVVEKIVYDFADFARHGIYREIPYLKTNKANKKFKLNFSHIAVVDENGKSYRFAKTEGTRLIRLKIGDPERTITGTHTYIISYKVSGALTYFSDHDELYWNVSGNDWTVPINSLTPGVKLPVGISQKEISKINFRCYTGLAGSTDSDCEAKIVGDEIFFFSKRIFQPREGMTIVVGFPKGIVAVLEPREVVNFWDTAIGKIVLLFITLAVVIALLFWYLIYPIKIIVKWYLTGRDPLGLQAEIRSWFDPPKAVAGRPLTPAETGSLIDEKVDDRDIFAMIVSLAQRGYLKIVEKKKGDFYFIKSKEFNDDKKLLDFEKYALENIFQEESEIRVKDGEFYRWLPILVEKIYQNLVREKFFPKNPEETRKFYNRIASLALGSLNLPLFLVALLFGRNLPVKTSSGVSAANVGRSLRNFLSSQERQLEFQAKNQLMFEKLLPFAIAFGVEKIWAKRFADIKMKQPDWYQSYDDGNFTSLLWLHSMNSSFSSFRSSSMTPTSSSSGFSSGFSGGFSGGGGGGGGGGSW